MGKRDLNRILCVDDDPDIQNLAKLTLEVIGGYIIEVCSSGEEALQKAVIFKPDLILLDIMMPGMDGPTTWQKLREIPETSTIPVIFFTAKAKPAEIAEVKAIGGLDVIIKPFSPMALPETIRKIWEQNLPQL
jgi:CheY-like chemotaxis protein